MGLVVGNLYIFFGSSTEDKSPFLLLKEKGIVQVRGVHRSGRFGFRLNPNPTHLQWVVGGETCHRLPAPTS